MDFAEYFHNNYLLKEAFETPSVFLFDPANSQKILREVEDDFKRDGGQVYGACYGKVYIHPKWNYVLKTFIGDSCYLKYARFAQENYCKAYPVFYGKPQKVVPHYLRHWSEEKLYAVRMEKLQPYESPNGRGVWHYRKELYHGDLYDHAQNSPVPEEKIREKFKNDPHTMEFYIGYNRLLKLAKDPYMSKKCRFDLHAGNILMRPDGQPVITDPFAYTACTEQGKLDAKKWNAYSAYDNPDRAKEQKVFVPGGKLSKKKYRNPFKP